MIYQAVVIHDQTYLPMYCATAVAFAAPFCTAAALGGRYTLRELETPSTSVVQALKLFNVLFAVFVCLLFLTKGTMYYSRASLALQFVAGSATLALARVVTALSACRMGGTAGDRGRQDGDGGVTVAGGFSEGQPDFRRYL